MDTFAEDIKSVDRELAVLADNGTSVAKSYSWEFVRVLRRAAVAAAIGGIKREVGGYVKTQGQNLVSPVGLLAMPVRGKRGPHGVFLELGTKYIVARHSISIAMDLVLTVALERAAAAAEKKINQLVEKGK